MVVEETSAREDILSIVCLAGEYPADKFHLASLQSESTVRRSVNRMRADKIASISGTRKRVQSETTGKTEMLKNESPIKTLRIKIKRLAKDGSPKVYRIIEETLGEEYLNNYLRISNNHTLSGAKTMVARRHRVAEIIALCKRTNIEVRPWYMPDIKSAENKITGKCFYDSLLIKEVVERDDYKLSFARFHGLIVSPGGAYVTYNYDASLMYGNKNGEAKSKTACSHILNLNWEPPYKLGRNRSAFDALQSVVIGADYDVALRVLREAESKKSRYLNVIAVYDDVYFIPQDNNGVSILKMITSENWRDRMIRAIIRPEMINSRGRTCDTLLPDGTNILACFDGNITLLKLLKSTLKKTEEKHLLLCFDWQEEFRTYFGDKVGIRSYPTERILSEFERVISIETNRRNR